MTTGYAEAVEGYAETAKDLAKKWRSYASDVAEELQTGYDANTASLHMGLAVSLSVETGVRLAWEAVDALTSITMAPNRPNWIESDREFSTQLPGAQLKVKEDLQNGPHQKLAVGDVKPAPEQLPPGQSNFRLRVNTAGYPAGIYRGTVVASLSPNQTDPVAVSIEVP